MARDHRRRRHHPRGRRRAHRPGGARRAAGEVRRAAGQDRLLLGRLQRDRHRVRHLRDLRAAPPARGPVLLGLRRGSAVRPDRDGRARGPTRSPTRTRSSCRRTSSSAGRRRPACWWRGGSCSPTGCPTSRAAAPSPTSTPPSTATSTTSRTREEGGTPAIIEAVRAGLVFQLKEAVGTETIRCAEERLLERAVAAWRDEPRHRAARQPRRRPAVDRVLRGALAVRPLPAPQLRRVAAQRPVRDPGPRRLLVRRPLRPPPAGHRPRALPRVRA